MKKLIIAGMALALLSGCSTFKRATGQIDDTVLPGQRSDILPPDQQVARDPNVQGGQGVPGNGAITQAPVNAPNGMATKPQVAGNMPRAAAPATANCDPKVDLCPEPLAPDPVAPVSPLKPQVPAKGTAAAKPGMPVAKTAVAGKPLVTNKPASPPTAVKVATKPPASATEAANGNLDAGVVITDPNKPATAATPAAKKPVAKKKPVKKPATTTAAAPAAPGAPAAPATTAPAAPAAPVPQGQ